MPMNSSQLKFIFLANVGQIMGNQYLNQKFCYPMLLWGNLGHKSNILLVVPQH